MIKLKKLTLIPRQNGDLIAEICGQTTVLNFSQVIDLHSKLENYLKKLIASKIGNKGLVHDRK